jgi:hypothetical protein
MSVIGDASGEVPKVTQKELLEVALHDAQLSLSLDMPMRRCGGRQKRRCGQSRTVEPL